MSDGFLILVLVAAAQSAAAWPPPRDVAPRIGIAATAARVRAGARDALEKQDGWFLAEQNESCLLFQKLSSDLKGRQAVVHIRPQPDGKTLAIVELFVIRVFPGKGREAVSIYDLNTNSAEFGSAIKHRPNEIGTDNLPTSILRRIRKTAEDLERGGK